MRYSLMTGFACAALVLGLTPAGAQSTMSMPSAGAESGPTEVAITAEDTTASLSKPLAPKARTAVKLPKMKGCTVSVAASFEGGGKSDADAFDVCREKLI